MRLLLLAVVSLTVGCATTAKRREADPRAPVAELPWQPGSEAAVRAWAVEHANPRDLSIDLTAEPPYLETALAPGSAVPRVGFFLRRDLWRVSHVLYWLPKTEQPPKVGDRAGQLWGLPVFKQQGGPELYVPAARIVVRVIDSSVALPEQPPVALPPDVPIKTPTLTFHRDLLFAVHDGRIWFKRNPALEGTLEEPWRLFGDGLPSPRKGVTEFDRPKRIARISADGDDLLAIDDRGRAYLCTTESKSVSSAHGWEDGWGFPGKRPLILDGRAKGFRALSIGRRAEHALYFEDPIGNPHHFGPMGTTTFYLLHQNGSELLFTDNGLPNDFARDLCGPDDGRFVAESLSASASAILLIDRYGRVVTRFEDYDLNGGTPNFEYTYRSVVRPDDDPASILSSQTPYFLPLLPWRWHAPPPISGKGRLSRDLTILQTGKGNAARELRIAGNGPDGASGYFKKGIDDATWSFVADPNVTIDPSHLLAVDDVAKGAADFERADGQLEQSALPRARNFRGTWTGQLQLPAAGGSEPTERVPDVSLSLAWNPFCPPARLTVTHQDVSFDVTLHTVDLWTPMRRDRPGFDGTPLLLLGTLVFDDAVLTDPRPAVREVVKLLRPYHHANFGLLIALDDEYVQLRAIDEGPGKNHPIAMAFHRVGAWDPPEPAVQAGTVDWLRRGDPNALVQAPELIVDVRTAPKDRIAQALADNQRLREELRALVARYQEQLQAIEEFRNRTRFLAPMLPLGRVNLLPKLLSLQLLRGQSVAFGAETDWKKLDAVLEARVNAYQAALHQ